MSAQNTFENCAQEYLGITKGSTGTLQVDSDLTVENNLIVEGQSTVQGVPGCFVKAVTAINASAIEFGSTIGGGTGSWDSRIVSFNILDPNVSNNLAIQTDGAVQVLAPLQAGSPTAPAFKLDYNSVSATAGVNQQTNITFTAGIFIAAPVVVCSVQTPGDQTGEQFCFVEDVTASGFRAQYLGTAAAGTKINYIALGI